MKMEKIGVLGAGESGVGAALLAKKTGAQVWVSDGGKIQANYRSILTEKQIPFEEGKHTVESFFDADVIIKSPGIPEKAPVIQVLRKQEKAIISEIEYAARHTEVPIIAVTGSNGKTTTTALIHHLLRQGGVEAALGGNIGKSFAALLAEGVEPEVFVLEVSSFQLDDVDRFHPQVAVLTNITADHLDRYDYSMEKYAAAKFRIAKNQTPKDAFIYQVDDPVTSGELWKHPVAAAKLGFAREQRSDAIAWLRENRIVAGYKFEVRWDNWLIRGPHNALNAMAAILAVQRFGLKEEEIVQGLRSFSPIEHRLETVAEIEGVTFINDSKATNIDAVIYGLESVQTPTIWIAGGLDKGNDYSLLDTSRVKALVILGPNKEKLLATYRDQMVIKEAANMPEAVNMAFGLAEEGDTVLLSPACSSFDIFKNYAERGRLFKEEVQRLEKKGR